MVRTAIEEMFAVYEMEPRPSHWSYDLPEIFDVEHAEGSLDLEAAGELIDRYETHGRRPEDLAFLRGFFADHRNAFSLPTYFSLQRYVEEAPLQTGPAWVARVQDGRRFPPILLPSLADLLGGRIELGAFSQILEHVRFLWFRGDLEAMANAAEVEAPLLTEYEEGQRQPRHYEEVVRLSHRLGLDADAVGYAWIAELRHRFKLDGEDNPRDALSRAQVLTDAAGLRLGRLPVGLTSALSPERVVEAIRQALSAGLEEQAVYAVFTELCLRQPQLFDQLSGSTAQLGRRKRVERGLIALRLASLTLQKKGELSRAALLEALAGDAIGRALRDGRLSGESLRMTQARHYEEALRLYEASGGGNTRWGNEAFARRLEQDLQHMRRGDADEGAGASRETAWFAARPAFSSPELSPVIHVISPRPGCSGYVNPPPGEDADLQFVDGVGYVPLPRPSLAVIAGAAAMVSFKAR